MGPRVEVFVTELIRARGGLLPVLRPFEAVVAPGATEGDPGELHLLLDGKLVTLEELDHAAEAIEGLRDMKRMRRDEIAREAMLYGVGRPWGPGAVVVVGEAGDEQCDEQRGVAP